MSCIEKMTIQGIRSFGVSDQDKGLIMFFAPLTLILGPNGTGKTTIIECLKYMTTGEMPPGGKMGAAFIHDPKIANDSEVKAQIRLLFRDIAGQKCMAIRSLVATQKRNKVELKTLDSVITRVMPNGEKQSISSKCAEMDREMVSLLGVSKAVLDNVIFCHQEESNWPLSEGKVLKQKFDDIFASTRYVKALDSIRKFRQEQMALIREYQAEIKYLKQNKEKAAEIAANLADRESCQLASVDTVKKAEAKLQPIREKLEKIMQHEDNIYKIKTTIEKLKSEKSQVEKGQRELRNNIKNEFRGSTEELNQELASFADKVAKMERNLKQNQDRLAELEKELEKHDKEKSRLLTEKGRLDQETERHEQNIKGRNQRVTKFAQQYGFPGFSDNITDDLAKELLTRLESKAKDLLEQAMAQKAEKEKKELELQKEIDAVRGKKTKLETEKKIKQERLTSNRDEVKKINQELSRVDASAGRLQDVDHDIRSIESELAEAERSVDVEALKAELLQLQKDKSKMDGQLKQLDTELTRLTQEFSVRTQLELHNKDKTSKEDQIRRLKAKNEDMLRNILGSIPTDNFNKALEKYLRDHSQQLRVNTLELQKMQNKIVALQTTVKMKQESLTKKRDELRGHETQITDATQGLDFDSGLANIKTKLEQNQDSRGHVSAVEYMFKKYIEKLRAHDPACPLCHRPFDEQSEVEELVNEMETKLNLVPEKLERLTSTITESKTEYERLLQLKPIYAVVKELKEKDIPALESSLDDLNSQIKKLSAEAEEKEELVDADKNDENIAKSMLSDATQIDRLQMELADVNRKIDAQTAKLAPGGSSRTLQEVQNEKSELQLEVDMANQKLERKRQKLNEHTERLQQLKSNLNELRSERLQIETDLQRQTRLEETKQELIRASEQLDHEIQDASEQIRPLQNKIDDIVEEKDRVTKAKEKQFEAGKEECAAVREHSQQVERFQSDINRYVREGRAEKLAECKKEVEKLSSKRDDLEERRTRFQDESNRIQHDLATQKIHQRELTDNVQLRKMQTEVEKIGKKIQAEEERLGGIDVENLSRERDSLDRENEKLVRERDVARSRQQQLEGEIVTLRRDLNGDMYKDADLKYREKMIALKTTEIANNDLDKYYKALDGTIMSYHNQKMSEINKIIRELWRNTYRGNDIETIEIRSDEEEGSGAAKTRRSYRYRVVMIKGSTELDMRGRCSAGQKVLASLIIRLALAETFCLNCGVLALDEPTTNLDRENIESLACALVEIIKNRHKQRNFQLVVITHDEDFVELLGRSEYVEEFFKVSKNDFGCSRLDRANVQDLHSK